jgi:hypothetical protein
MCGVDCIKRRMGVCIIGTGLLEFDAIKLVVAGHSKSDFVYLHEQRIAQPSNEGQS